MDTIIENNVIHAAAGDLVAIDRAYIVETDITELDLDIRIKVKSPGVTSRLFDNENKGACL